MYFGKAAKKVAVSTFNILSTKWNSNIFSRFWLPVCFLYLYECSILPLQIWDKNPDLLNNKGVTEASYALAGASVVISLGTAFITVSPPADK